MNRKLFFIVSVLFSTFSGFSQSSISILWTGKVVNLIDNQPIENANFEIRKREIMEENGIKYLLPLIYFSDSKMAKTDKNGNIEIEFHAQENEIWMLIVSKPGFHSAFHLYIPIEKKSQQRNFYIELVPEKLSEEEANIYALKNEIEKEALEIEKEYFSRKEKIDFSENIIETPNQITQTCSVTVPTEVYVSNLIDGYNSTPTGSGFTGMINFDEYIAGVVQKEIAGVTSAPEALKAMAVAARTFSYRRHTLNQPVNVGQAYKSSPNTACISAANATTQQVLLYNNAAITANYAARCNGNFTQNSEQGRWGAGTCGALCSTCGNNVAYLRSVICSGHQNCTNFSAETPCCELTISTVNALGNIYGHGVGLCQRGTQQFAGAPFNWNYCDILTHFYTNVCIANASCAAGNTQFSVATMSNPVGAGTILGGGIYNLNASSTLIATSNANFSFLNWSENGNILSTNPNLSISVTQNRNIVANFSAISDIEADKAINLKVFPNPNEGKFRISSQKLIKNIEIVNVVGQKMPFDLKYEGKDWEIELKEKTQGIYILHLKFESLKNEENRFFKFFVW